MNNVTRIPAPLKSIATDKTVAYASDIKDEDSGKFQQEINATNAAFISSFKDDVAQVNSLCDTIREAIKTLSPDQQTALSVAQKVNELQTTAEKLSSQIGQFSLLQLSELDYEKLKEDDKLDENTLYFVSENETTNKDTTE